ncbi:MAG: ribbon-helix-helix domain-containing protein [Armatimonadota bacterium]
MAQKKRNWKGTSLLMPANLLEDLDAAAEAQGFSSRADVIRVACSRFVSEQQKQERLDRTLPLQKERGLCRS